MPAGSYQRLYVSCAVCPGNMFVRCRSMLRLREPASPANWPRCKSKMARSARLLTLCKRLQWYEHAPLDCLQQSQLMATSCPWASQSRFPVPPHADIMLMSQELQPSAQHEPAPMWTKVPLPGTCKVAALAIYHGQLAFINQGTSQ